MLALFQMLVSNYFDNFLHVLITYLIILNKNKAQNHNHEVIAYANELVDANREIYSETFESL